MKLVYFALRTLENGSAGHYSFVPMSNVLRKFQLLTCIVLLFSLLSCSAKESPATRESALSKGFALLDRQQYDEAIQYFADLAEKDPHYQVKLAWASAYAARAGVKVEAIYVFVTAKSSAVPNLQIRSKEVPLDHQTRGLLAHLSTYAAVWDKIPFVGQRARDDLQKAVSILKQDQVPGVRLYSAALRAVILKSSIEDGLRNWDHGRRRHLCLYEVKPYWDWALRILEGLSQLALDLEGAFPSKKEFSEARLNLERLRSDAAALPIPGEEQCF